MDSEIIGDGKRIAENEPGNGSRRILRNVLWKALLLFLLANIVYALWGADVRWGKLSAYGVLFPGRMRFPFGENPQAAYNLSLYDLDAMFASHVVSAAAEDDDEFRVFVLGDSSIWGYLLQPEETLTGQLNRLALTAPDGRQLRFYNLGYPSLALVKDLMLIEMARQYEPDLFIWAVTLESFPKNRQLEAPIAANNLEMIGGLSDTYALALDPAAADNDALSIGDKTIIGQRRRLADLIRLQLYGVMWAATGVDQVYTEDFEPAQRDFSEDETFYDFQPPQLDRRELSLDLIQAGIEAAGEMPLIIVNEPILISDGENSDIRYNFYYPRWVYDRYREIMLEEAQENDWHYYDCWDLVDEAEFTNTAIHLTPQGSELFAGKVEMILEEVIRIYW